MIDSRVRNYALTAGGVAALAAAGATSADIVSSSGGPVSIDTNTGPTTLFTVGGVSIDAKNIMSGTWLYTGYGTCYLGPIQGSAVLGTVNDGQAIGPGFSLSNSVSYASIEISFGYGKTSEIRTFGLILGSSILVGLEIYPSDMPVDGDAYHAWIEYSISANEGEFTYTIDRWAYNDVAGEGIIAGQNVAAGSSAVPGLGGLAALAIGAAGVRSRRQRTVA